MVKLRIQIFLIIIIGLVGATCEEDPVECPVPGKCACVFESEYLCWEAGNDYGEWLADDCRAAGGKVKTSACPTKNAVGFCADGDDCHNSDHYFYDGTDFGGADTSNEEEMKIFCEDYNCFPYWNEL